MDKRKGLQTLAAFGLVLTVFLCSAQSPETFLKLKELPKGDTDVIIKTTDDLDLAFKKMAMLVMDYGFTIANSDKELYFMNTEEASVNDYMFKTRVSIRMKKLDEGTQITLKGTGINGTFNFEAINKHRKDVPNTVFAQLYEIAIGYSGGTVSSGS